jgi:hypothetical protein
MPQAQARIRPDEPPHQPRNRVHGRGLFGHGLMGSTHERPRLLEDAMANSTDALTRRTALAALGGALAGVVSAAAATPAAAQSATYRAITIDTQPLARLGAARAAELIRRELQRELPAAFAGRITGARSAPTLIVRVTALSLAGFAGDGGGNGSGGSTVNTDYLEGEALVVPAGSRTPVQRVPVLSAVPSSSAGAWYAPDNELRRINYITSHFAGWMAKKV